MSLTYLHKRRPDAKQVRFCTIGITPTLFGDWALIREWGRIGQTGTVRETWFDDRNEAEQARGLLLRQKQKGVCAGGISVADTLLPVLFQDLPQEVLL